MTIRDWAASIARQLESCDYATRPDEELSWTARQIRRECGLWGISATRTVIELTTGTSVRWSFTPMYQSSIARPLPGVVRWAVWLGAPAAIAALVWWAC